MERLADNGKLMTAAGISAYPIRFEEHHNKYIARQAIRITFCLGLKIGNAV